MIDHHPLVPHGHLGVPVVPIQRYYRYRFAVNGEEVHEIKCCSASPLTAQPSVM